MTTACCNVCKLDDNKEYCVGCNRTVEEIRLAGVKTKNKRKEKDNASKV
jgi:predicted Fe-S protein YdhL (DUF1289 family)